MTPIGTTDAAPTTATTPVGAPPGTNGARTRGQRGSGARRAAVGALVVLSSLAVLASSLAVWARLTIFDEDRFAALVADVADEPAVVTALSERLVDEVVAVLEARAEAGPALPPALAPFAPALAGGLRAFVEGEVEEVLASDAAQDLVVALARRAHAAAMALLEGDGVFGDGVSVADGEVTLDLVPLIGDVLGALQRRGLLPADVALPELSAEGDHSEQVRLLGERLGITLEPGTGQVTVYESHALGEAQATVARAQDAVALFERAVALVVAVAVVLVALALALSTDRWRTLAQLGLGTAVAMVVVLVVVDRVVAALAEEVADPEGRAATRAVLSTAATGLHRVTWALLLGGVLVAAVGFFWGRSATAAAARSWAGGAGVRAGSGNRRGASVWAAIGRHADGARLVVLGLAVLVLVLSGLSWASLVLVAAVAVVGLAVVGLARRAPPSAAA